MSDYHFISPQKKILTPMIPLESACKAQGKQMLLTPAQEQKVREFMAKYPGPITLHFDAKTGQLVDMEKAVV